MRHTIREWDEIHVPSGVIDEKTADQLCELALRESKRLKVSTPTLSWSGRQSLKAGQVVGVLALPHFTLEILPKIEDENDVSLRNALTYMLSVAWDLPVVTSTTSSMKTQDQDLLEALIGSFTRAFLAVLRRGLPRRYKTQEEELTLLRGRLNVKRQVVNNLVRPDKLACVYDELSVDTPLSRVLKAAVGLLESHARSAGNRRRLLELRARLENVADSTRPLAEPVRLDRTNTVFHQLYGLARLFLQYAWQSTTSGSVSGIAMLFPMNDLFEAFVARSLCRALPEQDVRVQDSGKYALTNKDGYFMRLRPDVVVGGQTVIDTKWKRLNPEKSDLGVSQSDVYQMLAYGRAYDAQRLVLLYPWISSLRPQHIQRRWEVQGSKAKLEVATLDIRDPRAARARLRQMVDDPESSWSSGHEANNREH